jgi:hypothetical protein
MADTRHQNPTVVPRSEIWPREQPKDLRNQNPDGSATEEMKRLSRIIHAEAHPSRHVEMKPGGTDENGNVVSADGMHYRPEVDLNAAIPTWIRSPGVNGTLRNPITGPLDTRPSLNGGCKFIDDGGGNFPRPHASRNPGEFRTEAEAKAEVELLRKKDPNGNYLIVNASQHGDLWVVARRGEVNQVLDIARGNRKPTEEA